MSFFAGLFRLAGLGLLNIGIRCLCAGLNYDLVHPQEVVFEPLCCKNNCQTLFLDLCIVAFCPPASSTNTCHRFVFLRENGSESDFRAVAWWQHLCWHRSAGVQVSPWWVSWVWLLIPHAVVTNQTWRLSVGVAARARSWYWAWAGI